MGGGSGDGRATLFERKQVNCGVRANAQCGMTHILLSCLSHELGRTGTGHTDEKQCTLRYVDVFVEDTDFTLDLETEESYELSFPYGSIPDSCPADRLQATVKASSHVGALRALETFAQFGFSILVENKTRSRVCSGVSMILSASRIVSDDHSVPLDVCPLLSRGAFSPVECCRTEDVCNVVEWGRPCPACLQTSPGLPLLFPLASASGQVAAYSYRGD
eukprot:1765911-Rhodomonas_salina.1